MHTGLMCVSESAWVYVCVCVYACVCACVHCVQGRECLAWEVGKGRFVG